MASEASVEVSVPAAPAAPELNEPAVARLLADLTPALRAGARLTSVAQATRLVPQAMQLVAQQDLPKRERKAVVCAALRRLARAQGPQSPLHKIPHLEGLVDTLVSAAHGRPAAVAVPPPASGVAVVDPQTEAVLRGYEAVQGAVRDALADDGRVTLDELTGMIPVVLSAVRDVRGLEDPAVRRRISVEVLLRVGDSHGLPRSSVITNALEAALGLIEDAAAGRFAFDGAVDAAVALAAQAAASEDCLALLARVCESSRRRG